MLRPLMLQRWPRTVTVVLVGCVIVFTSPLCHHQCTASAEPLGDRTGVTKEPINPEYYSGQIIKEQDAEEGEGWDSTDWTLHTESPLITQRGFSTTAALIYPGVGATPLYLAVATRTWRAARRMVRGNVTVDTRRLNWKPGTLSHKHRSDLIASYPRVRGARVVTAAGEHGPLPYFNVLGLSPDILCENNVKHSHGYLFDNDTLCKKPVPPENGYITGNDYNDGGVVQIHCDKGYTLSGPTNITCVPVPHPDAPGVWLPQDEYKCLRRRVIEIYTLDGHDTAVVPPYTLPHEGTDNLVLGEKNLSPKDKPTSVHGVKCSKPADPIHGRTVGHDFSLYARVGFLCDDGYSLVGPEHITCLPVPDPFNHLAIWEPQTHPICRDTHHDTIHTTSRCSQPKVVGPCTAAIPRFYFNAAMHECLPFTYGGCHGNDNNFETFTACQTACP